MHAVFDSTAPSMANRPNVAMFVVFHNYIKQGELNLRDHIVLVMHLSIVCPTSPCMEIGGAKGEFDSVVYFNPAPLGLY